jgi:carbonic anhydrase
MKTKPNSTGQLDLRAFPRDLTAGLVVFLVAVPLCLGVAEMVPGVPKFAGLISGVIGGIIVGVLSGSHTSVSGPSPGLVAVLIAQMAIFTSAYGKEGAFPALMMSIIIAGVIQVIMGFARLGFIASFFPSSVIKGLLAAIGVILILKQLPHVIGHDIDPEGDSSFWQGNLKNTFTELWAMFQDLHWGAAIIGFTSIAIIVLWDKWPVLKKLPIPAPLAVVSIGVLLNYLFQQSAPHLVVNGKHLVNVPLADDLSKMYSTYLIYNPDIAHWLDMAILSGAFTLAMVASLETLLNLEAVDRIDPYQRTSPSSRELIAQGVGNMTAGLIGGLPVSSVIVRSSVNINAGARTKLAAVIHGVLLLLCLMFMPGVLNMIPIASLAAILFMTGIKLINPELIKRMWAAGRYQFIPFAVTIVAIVFTDLLTGVIIGLTVSVGFILNSNLRRPMRQTIEKHVSGEVLRIELANQVSFLNRAALSRLLDTVDRGGHILIDAQNTDYIDPDILELIRDFKEIEAPARGIDISLSGFRSKYQLEDNIQFIDYSTRELQQSMTPVQVLGFLKSGYERFRSGKRLQRDLSRSVSATAAGQHPLAVILSCIDSRSPAELIFDCGVGDIFNVRIAGNVTSNKVLASIEYATSVAGAKLVLVMGHTKCGAVNAAVQLLGEKRSLATVTGCQHIESIIGDIQKATQYNLGSEQGVAHDSTKLAESLKSASNPLNGITNHMTLQQQEEYADEVSRRNVMRVVREMQAESNTLANLVKAGRIAIVGAMYDITTSEITFLDEQEIDSSSNWGRMEEKMNSDSNIPAAAAL